MFARAQGVYIPADTWRNLRRQLDMKMEDTHIVVHEHNKARSAARGGGRGGALPLEFAR